MVQKAMIQFTSSPGSFSAVMTQVSMFTAVERNDVIDSVFNQTSRLAITEDFINSVRPESCRLCMHSPPGGLGVKIVNNGVVSPYPSCSVVHNAVVSGPAAAGCTL